MENLPFPIWCVWKAPTQGSTSEQRPQQSRVGRYTEGSFVSCGNVASTAPISAFVHLKNMQNSFQIRHEGQEGLLSSAKRSAAGRNRLLISENFQVKAGASASARLPPQSTAPMSNGKGPPWNTGNKIEPHLGRTRLTTMQTLIMLV